VRLGTLVFFSCVMIAAPCFAEATLDLGAGGETRVEEGESATVEPFLKGAASLTIPLSEELSALADAAARIGQGLPDGGTAYAGYAAADLAYRRGLFFGRIGAVSTFDDGDAYDSAYYDVATDTEITLDFDLFTISFAPNLRFIQSDARRIEAEGALWSILAAGDQTILRARLEGGIAWPEDGTEEYFAAASAGFSLYPAALLVVTGDAGFKRSVSTNSLDETIDDTVVTIPHANGFNEYFLSLEASGSLSRDVRFTVFAPAKWRVSDHGAVEGSAVTDETEWRFSLLPGFSLEFILSPAFSLKATCGADLVFSNSDYLEERAGYLRIESILSIR
jgi:hypothetical protein